MLSNYINVDGNARISLLNGPLVLYDKQSGLKSVTIIRGLIKKRQFLSSQIVANTEENAKILDGIIYKVKKDAKPPTKLANERHNLVKLDQLQDVHT